MKNSVLFCLLLLVVTMAQAKDVYIWVDDSGKKHFSDQKPKGIEAQQKNYGVEKKPEEEAVISTAVMRTSEDLHLAFVVNQPLLLDIYHTALLDEPELEGFVRFQITILASGQVELCQVLASDFKNSALNTALREAVKSFDFGRAEVETTVTTWGLTFSPDDRWQ